MKKIGITGGVAEGKSTVLGIIKDLGHAVVSCDVIARSVFDTPPVVSFLAEYGAKHPSDFSTLRDQSRAWMLADPVFKAKLEQIMHPLIVKEMLDDSALIAEVPLLYECGLALIFENVWVVSCGPEQQLERLTERLGNVQQAKALISAQIGRDERESRADLIIDTSGPIHTVKAQVIAGLLQVFPAGPEITEPPEVIEDNKLEGLDAWHLAIQKARKRL